MANFENIEMGSDPSAEIVFVPKNEQKFYEGAHRLSRVAAGGAPAIKLPRYLCLHGWRTSGFILQCQSAALRAQVQIDCIFPDAIIKARGPPDQGIQTFYPNIPYFEWYIKNNDTTIEQSLDFLYQFFVDHGPFDGILGFSQGGAMATLLAQKLSAYDRENAGERNLKLILIAAIDPPFFPSSSSAEEVEKVLFPSLHVWGENDYVLPRSVKLKSLFYSDESSVVITHSEDHRVPSMHTGIFPAIKEWIHSEKILTESLSETKDSTIPDGDC